MGSDSKHGERRRRTCGFTASATIGSGFSALEELLDLGAAASAPGGAAVDPSSRGWKTPDPKIEPTSPPSDSGVSDARGSEANTGNSTTSPPSDSGVSDAAGETPKPAFANRPSFVSRALGRGQIVAIKPENVFADGRIRLGLAAQHGR